MPEFRKKAVLGFRYVVALEQFYSESSVGAHPLLSFHPGPYSYNCDSRALYKVRKYLLQSSYLAFTLSKLALV